jgi:hypothetical protein
MSTSEISLAVENRHPPEFAEAYMKAHRTYGAVAGLLLAWEVIGIDLSREPLTDLKITFKSPEAAPWVLAALLIYFSFRLTVEWYQTDPTRRRLRASIVDYFAAHAIAAASLIVLLVQRAIQRQLFSFIPFEGTQVAVLAGAFISGSVITRTALIAIRDQGFRELDFRTKRTRAQVFVLVAWSVVLSLTMATSSVFYSDVGAMLTALASALGALSFVAISSFIRRQELLAAKAHLEQLTAERDKREQERQA